MGIGMQVSRGYQLLFGEDPHHCSPVEFRLVPVN